jgi:dCTP deaminase
MVVLTKPDLERLIKEGEIVCIPPGKINPSSIDVSLGNSFFRQTMGFDPVIPYADSGATPLWVSTPGELTHHEGKDYIQIDPQETILATTEEFIGARGKYTPVLKSKSTSGRNCLDLCGSAGWGDPGYISRWAFPLRNTGNRSIFLLPGTWIGQIAFFEASTPLDSEENYTSTGQYQNTNDIEKLMANWDPTSILPGAMKLK